MSDEETKPSDFIREAVAEAGNPAMLYSLGKDSSVMLHLARKAFYPSPPPFPLLHVDTRWMFQEMYLFRDYMARESGMDLLVHINPEAIARSARSFCSPLARASSRPAARASRAIPRMSQSLMGYLILMRTARTAAPPG